jgi:type IV pilus assembly protein PilA
MNTRSRKGFTLVEIMIVVVIIALLAAMAIPAFQKVRQNSIKSTLDNDLKQICGAAQQYFLEYSASSVDTADLIPAYMPSWSKGNSAAQAVLAIGGTMGVSNGAYVGTGANKGRSSNIDGGAMNAADW